MGIRATAMQTYIAAVKVRPTLNQPQSWGCFGGPDDSTRPFFPSMIPRGLFVRIVGTVLTRLRKKARVLAPLTTTR
jgi:hypothetical protein